MLCAKEPCKDAISKPEAITLVPSSRRSKAHRGNRLALAICVAFIPSIDAPVSIALVLILS
jgi:hypothetical protein